MKLISCRAGLDLAELVAIELKRELGKISISNFGDGEIEVVLDESVRNEDVFVIQCFSKNINDDLMELLLVCDCLRRSSAGKIILIMPYFPYSRQDKMLGREPISAQVVAKMLESVGADSIVTFDLHSRQVQGFFNIPCDNLTALKLMADKFKLELSSEDLKKLVVVSPDVGGVKRARDFAALLNCDLAIVEKSRIKSEVKVFSLIGDVTGKNAVLVDDIVDSGSTLISAARLVKSKGAGTVFACVTHPTLSKGFEQLEASDIAQFITTDSIPHKIGGKKFSTVSLSGMLAEVIKRLEAGNSISELL